MILRVYHGGPNRVCQRRPDPMPRTKKPKVQIKREKTSLGWAYRIYIGGKYIGTALTAASAREGAKQILARRTPPGSR